MSGPDRSPVAHRILVVAWVAYLVAVAVLVFQPDASAASDSVGLVDRVVRAAGAPSWLGPQVIEVVANVVLFVPLGLLGAGVVHRWSVLFWGLCGLALSAVIELIQLLFLPGRSATWTDLAANTGGAVLGMLVLRLVLRYRRSGSVP